MEVKSKKKALFKKREKEGEMVTRYDGRMSAHTCFICGQLVGTRNGVYTIHWPDMDAEDWCSATGEMVPFNGKGGGENGEVP